MSVNTTAILASGICDNLPLSGRSGWVSSPNTRGTLDILWGCFSALFICLWSMLHLNIPAKGDSRWVRFWRRARWLTLGVIAPEVTLLFACGQWTSAKRSVKEMHAMGYKGWTITHAFYADMGGFVLETPDCEGSPFPLTAKQVAYLVREGYMPLPTITKAEIKDKGNADYIAKSLAYFQTSWLTVQVIARAIQRLPVSLLELGAIAMCFCSLATLWYWLQKPLDVETPTHIVIATTTAEIVQKAMHSEGGAAIFPGRSGDVEECNVYKSHPESTCTEVSHEKDDVTFKCPARTDTIETTASDDTLIEAMSPNSVLGVTDLDLKFNFKLPRTDSILTETTFAPASTAPTSHISRSFYENHIADTPLEFIEPNIYMSSKSGPRTLRMVLGLGLQTRPLNRIPDDRDPWLDSVSQHIAIGIFTAAFCSIPVAGWNFEFGTRWEELLYKTCCVGMWGMMCAYGTSEWVLGWSKGFTEMFLDKGNGYKIRWPTAPPYAFVFSLYTAFRLGLLFEALYSLRDMPNGVFIDVSWTAMIPHI